MNNEQNRIAQLELHNAFLVAQLAKQNGLNASANPQHAFDDAGNALQPPNALVRSQSNMGYGSGNAVMGQYDSHPQAVKRQRAYSQQASSGMPFRNNGSIAPLSAPMARSQSSRPRSRGDMQRSPSGLSPQPLHSIREQGGIDSEGPGVGMDPDDFLASRPDESSYLSMTSTNLSPTALDQHHQGPGIAPPSLVSGSSALEDSPDMSRQHSSFGQWHASTPMINSTSQQSFFGDSAWGESQSFIMPEGDDPKSYASSQDFVGFGGAFPTAENYANNMFLPLESVSMDRSASNNSNCSNRSTASNLEKRARERHEQVLRNSATAIKPKPQEPGKEAGPAKKIAVSKPAPARRKQNKVTCPVCPNHPEFRGEHERNRHMASKHADTVTKFICRDPAAAGLQSSVQPKVPLKGCKACDSGKLYGAYYNAGAHLRRWHFNPRASRGKGKRSEKRGGSAGGYWPEMDDLKVWFEEVTVPKDQQTKSQKSPVIEVDDDDMAELEDNAEDTPENELPAFMETNTGFEMPETQPSQPCSMVPDLNQAGNFQATGTELFDFAGYPEASYGDNAPPFFGAGSPATFTPASNYELWC